jgi:hypothetical protein
MKMCVMLIVATMVLAGCGAPHEQQVATAPSAHAGLVTPRSGASTVAPAGLVTPRSGASEAARAAGAESRKVIIPKIRDVPVRGVTSPASAARKLPKGVPYASDTDPVRIVSYTLSSTIVHPGDKVTGDVITSSNAASVTAQVGAFSVAVPKVAPGKFHLQMQLPSLPLPAGDAKLTITAVRTDGKSTTREVAITVVL